MFKIDPAPLFSGEVDLTIPGESAAGRVAFKFRHKGREALKAWLEASAGRTDADVLGEVIADWRDVVDGQGQAVEYSPATLGQLLDAYPAAGNEIFAGYLKALTESRQKN